MPTKTGYTEMPTIRSGAGSPRRRVHDALAARDCVTTSLELAEEVELPVKDITAALRWLTAHGLAARVRRGAYRIVHLDDLDPHPIARQARRRQLRSQIRAAMRSHRSGWSIGRLAEHLSADVVEVAAALAILEGNGDVRRAGPDCYEID